MCKPFKYTPLLCGTLNKKREILTKQQVLLQDAMQPHTAQAATSALAELRRIPAGQDVCRSAAVHSESWQSPAFKHELPEEKCSQNQGMTPASGTAFWKMTETAYYTCFRSRHTRKALYLKCPSFGIPYKLIWISYLSEINMSHIHRSDSEHIHKTYYQYIRLLDSIHPS